MSRRAAVEAIVWIVTAFFTIQMFSGPVRELIQRLTATTDGFPP